MSLSLLCKLSQFDRKTHSRVSDQGSVGKEMSDDGSSRSESKERRESYFRSSNKKHKSHLPLSLQIGVLATKCAPPFLSVALLAHLLGPSWRNETTSHA
jgi:hypothetical protein